MSQIKSESTSKKSADSRSMSEFETINSWQKWLQTLRSQTKFIPYFPMRLKRKCGRCLLVICLVVEEKLSQNLGNFELLQSEI